MNDIELEYRSEVNVSDFEMIKSKLEETGKLKSHVKRLSFMSFGKLEDKTIDVRVRITNDDAEVVVKRGSFHGHNRIEFSQKISKDQLLGFSKLFFLIFEGDCLVGGRETYNYIFNESMTVSLVRTEHIAYLEFEKISSKEKEESDKKEVLDLMKKFDLKVMDEDGFKDICKRLQTTGADWKFSGSDADFARLEELIGKH
jgi:hypothetical protein